MIHFKFLVSVESDFCETLIFKALEFSEVNFVAKALEFSEILVVKALDF